MLDNHTSCIIDEVEKLINRGFTCYLEYKINNEKKKNAGIFVDVFAFRKSEEIIIEVGTCSYSFKEYKKYKPNAKIIFVHQLKNHGVNGSTILQLQLNRIRKKELNFFRNHWLIPVTLDTLREPLKMELVTKLYIENGKNLPLLSLHENRTYQSLDEYRNESVNRKFP